MVGNQGSRARGGEQSARRLACGRPTGITAGAEQLRPASARLSVSVESYDQLGSPGSTAGCGKPQVRWCGRVAGRNPRHSTRSRGFALLSPNPLLCRAPPLGAAPARQAPVRNPRPPNRNGSKGSEPASLLTSMLGVERCRQSTRTLLRLALQSERTAMMRSIKTFDWIGKVAYFTMKSESPPACAMRLFAIPARNPR